MLKEKYKSILVKYLPPNTVDYSIDLIFQHNISLTITKGRSTKFGDYRPPQNTKGHRITLNYNLNQFAFFITLIHEIAHLVNWNKHRSKVKPHGEEWKYEFGVLMNPFLNESTFPTDILKCLKVYFQNPKASSSSDTLLMKALIQHNNEPTGTFIEELPENSIFTFKGNRTFRKGEQIRKRFRCIEIKTKKIYLFNPLAVVELIE